MMELTVIPSADELAPLLAEATSERDEGAFVAIYMTNLSDLLRKDPKQYRSYGPWWWPLKAMLIEHGHEVGAGGLEMGTAERYTLESAALTVCAAWAYQQRMIEQGYLRCSEHWLDLDDGETYEYNLYDSDMEQTGSAA
ncbi:hypothetical protein ACSZNO_21480 [Aeromonas veronii]